MRKRIDGGTLPLMLEKFGLLYTKYNILKIFTGAGPIRPVSAPPFSEFLGPPLLCRCAQSDTSSRETVFKLTLILVLLFNNA